MIYVDIVARLVLWRDGKREASERVKFKRTKGIAIQYRKYIHQKRKETILNIDTDNDQLKAFIRKWFSMLDNNKGENLPWGESVVTVTTPWHVLFYICIIAGNRLQSIKAKVNAEFDKSPVSQDKLYQEAGIPKPVDIPKYANGRSRLLANIETFGDGTYIVIAGSRRKNPCMFLFKDGEIVFSTCEDNVQHRVLEAWTTMDNEQLLAQQERLDNRRAA